MTDVMKNFKNYLFYLSIFALIFTSCSKEDEGIQDDPNAETGTISFGTILNDLIADEAEIKQAVGDLPACSGDVPAFVEVVLTGPTNVGSMENPLVVSVNGTPGNYDGDPEVEYFTNESPDLELEPGTYTLEYFAVYDSDPNADGTLLWMAPREGGDLANFVENPLPFDFNLGAGVKKYVDVDVICYDDRMVNEYGYMFFEFEGSRAIEFCIFGNYCPPSGRHFPAQFSVDVWLYEDGARGQQLYDGLQNRVELDENGDYAGTTLCMALPDREGLDEYYIEITLLDSDAYGDIEERIIRSGVINDDEVKSLFDGDNNLDYYHFKEGCGSTDEPPIVQDPEDEALHYKTCLTQLNDSKAVGFAYFRLENNLLETTIVGLNLEPNEVHAQHIHGFEDGTNSTCPPSSASGDDEWITMEEGAPYYGESLLALSYEDDSFPTADASGMYQFQQSYTLGQGGLPNAEDLLPLENTTVVFHGMTVDGEYEASLPVACAETLLLEDY